MPKAEHELQKHTMNFVEGDFEDLRRLYPEVEVSTLIRELVHDFVLRAKAAQESPKVEGVAIQLDLGSNS